MATLIAQENSPKSYPYHFGTVQITNTTRVKTNGYGFKKETWKNAVSALADH